MMKSFTKTRFHRPIRTITSYSFQTIGIQLIWFQLCPKSKTRLFNLLIDNIITWTLFFFPNKCIRELLTIQHNTN